MFNIDSLHRLSTKSKAKLAVERSKRTAEQEAQWKRMKKVVRNNVRSFTQTAAKLGNYACDIPVSSGVGEGVFNEIKSEDLRLFHVQRLHQDERGVIWYRMSWEHVAPDQGE